MKNKKRGFASIVLLFVVLNALFLLGRGLLARWGASQELLILGNLLLFGITVLSYFMAIRGLKNPNPHAFVRSVFSSILLKLAVSLIAASAYIAWVRKDLNKPGFFTLMGLYLLYTFIEVTQLTRELRRQKKDG